MWQRNTAALKLFVLNVALVTNSKIVPPKTILRNIWGKQISIDEVDRQEPRIATITLDKKEPLKSITHESVGKN